MRNEIVGDVTAAYPLHPECPQCAQPLARPGFWLELKPEQRRNTFQIWCATCKRTVSAKFYMGGFE